MNKYTLKNDMIEIEIIPRLLNPVCKAVYNGQLVNIGPEGEFRDNKNPDYFVFELLRNLFLKLKEDYSAPYEVLNSICCICYFKCEEIKKAPIRIKPTAKYKQKELF